MHSVSVKTASKDLSDTEIARRIGELTPPLASLEASFARGRIVHDGPSAALLEDRARLDQWLAVS